jgi:formylglycine-generating enzyme required for sulfatase activity
VVPIVAAAVVIVGGLGIGGYFLLRGSKPERTQTSTKVSASSSAQAAGSAAAMPPASKCPEGMIFVAGGKMFMGARDLQDDAKPPHEVKVSDFCLDKTEVPTSAYDACVQKGECERPAEEVSWSGVSPAAVKLYTPFCNYGKNERSSQPINCVGWPLADNFCKKRGARLPTEAEWEYAARGSVQRKYPWGDDPPGARFLNACGKECAGLPTTSGTREIMHEEDDGFVGTAPVGSFKDGASSHGIMDLAGNVWEWTSDFYGPYGSAAEVDPKGPATGTERVLRGGDFTGARAEWARPAWRWKSNPDAARHAVGFRCAK